MFSQSFSRCTAGDPKLWPSYIKYATLANLCMFVFMGNMYSSGIATGFLELAISLKVPIPKLIDLIAYSVLCLGVSSVLWMPIALCVGKRPVIIASLLVFLAGSIWGQYAQTYNSLLGSRIVASLGAGSVETLGPSIIGDMFFERRYATAIAFLQMFLALGSQIGPLIAGYLISARGWQWLFKLCSILIGINLLFVLFFLPETSYRRNVFDGQPAAEPEAVSDKLGEAETIEEVHHESNGATNPQYSAEEANARYAGSYAKDLVAFRNRGAEAAGIRRVFTRAIEPFQFLAVPQVVYAGLSFGLIIGGIVVISSLGPQLLSPPPYLFTSKSLGLFPLSSLIGVVIAYPLAGPLTDAISGFMRRRAGGKHMPEHRFPALIIPFFLCPPGLILYAYTIAAKRSYVIAGVGFAMQSAGLVLVPSVTLSFVIDTYPRRSGEALVLINAIKNCVAFGLTKATADWFAVQGLKKLFLEMAAIQWAIILLALPLYFVSPWLRQKTLRFL